MTSIFIKRVNLDIGVHTERTPREDEGGDWGDPSTSHGMAKIASKPPEDWQEAWRVSLSDDIR